MIYLALKTWFQTYGALLRLLMINMRYKAYHIGENNVSPSMPLQEIQGRRLSPNSNDIEDMLLLVVQNRLNNLSGDDVADFAIALRMRNRLMRSDELYKFSDGTLTRLLSSLEDITKNIDMTYLPKRRWSTLEKKRGHFMIKDINKLLKERRMMRSLEKFVGGRLYETDLRLLQRTI
ncbi:hypothetical protein Tco_0946167 [Tanacetum coccineum]